MIMEQFTYPIREVLRNKKIKQEDLARTLGRTRQTVSRYIAEYERTGKVGDPKAQAEFDRLMAEENQRLLDYEDTNQRLNMIKVAKETLASEDKERIEMYENFKKELRSNHPDLNIDDFVGKIYSNEIRPDQCDTEEQMAALSESEKQKLIRFIEDGVDNSRKHYKYMEMERGCNKEKLWDSTIIKGKPKVYYDEFFCSEPDDDYFWEPYNFKCETFCLCSGNTARIIAKGIEVPRFEHDMKMEVSAAIQVITDSGFLCIDKVVLEPVYADDPSTWDPPVMYYDGRIDNLIPGYKYLYCVCIYEGTGAQGIYTQHAYNAQEITLRDGGYWTNVHPLK